MVTLTIISESKEKSVLECDEFKIESGFLKLTNGKFKGPENEAAEEIYISLSTIKSFIVKGCKK